jgi:hypothetical protein
MGLLAAAGVAALGALILGEYPYTGVLVVAAGVILGLFVAETFLAVARRRGLAAAGLCAALTAAGLIWGGWISYARDLGAVPGAGWSAVAIGAAAAAVRAAWRAPEHSPPVPSPSESPAAEPEGPAPPAL